MPGHPDLNRSSYYLRSLAAGALVGLAAFVGVMVILAGAIPFAGLFSIASCFALSLAGLYFISTRASYTLSRPSMPYVVPVIVSEPSYQPRFTPSRTHGHPNNQFFAPAPTCHENSHGHRNEHEHRHPSRR